jgi:hypothetical protein
VGSGGVAGSVLLEGGSGGIWPQAVEVAAKSRHNTNSIRNYQLKRQQLWRLLEAAKDSNFLAA